MSSARTRTRGQPLVVLFALLLGWAGARITSRGGEQGLSLPEAVLTVGTATAAQSEGSGQYRTGPQSYPDQVYAADPQMPMRQIQYLPMWYGGMPRYATTAVSPDPRYGRDEPRFFGDIPQEGPIAPSRIDDRAMAAGLPPLHGASGAAQRYGEPASVLGGRLGRMLGDPAHWSMDAWALMRNNGTKLPAPGTLPATYGASQAGAVLRYRFSLQDKRQLTAYLRTTSTVGGVGETSAALGLSARPLATVPIVAAIEGRVTEQAGTRRIQPAVMAVTVLPPLALPGALRAEVYGQGGYVAGRYATPFADGQLRVDRSVASIGRIEARVGAGAWGGIQKGASRLDAGPGATVSLPLSRKVFGRVAVDWRFRVAGNAEPDSGPALTVAAGF